MNRRIPIGTYGGVGGRRLITSSYPIVWWQPQQRYRLQGGKRRKLDLLQNETILKIKTKKMP